MKRDWKIEPERGDISDAAGTEPFLRTLRQRMERTLWEDAEEPKKVGLGDYLKLATLLEISRAASTEELREVVVRWEDPSDEGGKDAD
ncbi:MAG: hypothetical protein KJZ70_04545 [Bryobacterales bacterium]|nr:hypothetical protein [Bryobacterales bacterium]